MFFPEFPIRLQVAATQHSDGESPRFTNDEGLKETLYMTQHSDGENRADSQDLSGLADPLLDII